MEDSVNRLCCRASLRRAPWTADLPPGDVAGGPSVRMCPQRMVSETCSHGLSSRVFSHVLNLMLKTVKFGVGDILRLLMPSVSVGKSDRQSCRLLRGGWMGRPVQTWPQGDKVRGRLSHRDHQSLKSHQGEAALRALRPLSSGRGRGCGAGRAAWAPGAARRGS